MLKCEKVKHAGILLDLLSGMLKRELLRKGYILSDTNIVA